MSKSFTRDKLRWLEQVQDDPEISYQGFALAFVLSTYFNSDTGEAWPSQMTLAARLHLKNGGDRTVRQLLKVLIDRGHLIKAPPSSSRPGRPGAGPGRGHLTAYKMNLFDPAWEKPGNDPLFSDSPAGAENRRSDASKPENFHQQNRGKTLNKTGARTPTNTYKEHSEEPAEEARASSAGLPEPARRPECADRAETSQRPPPLRSASYSSPTLTAREQKEEDEALDELLRHYVSPPTAEDYPYEEGDETTPDDDEDE